MPKRSKKSGKKKAMERSSKFDAHNLSSLAQHKQHGRKLSPPLNQLPLMTESAWVDDHMPEMLWAVILAHVFKREDCLACFREVAAHCRDWFLSTEDNDVLGSESTLDHTTVATFTDEQFKEFIKLPLAHPLGYAALRPLLLIECLPGIERWRAELGVEPTEYDWKTLGFAVAKVLDHQSQESTDARWLKVAFGAITGRMVFPSAMTDIVEELRLYPNKGDMRKVRPTIRSTEMAFRRNPPSRWVRHFWAEVFEKTLCIDPSEGREYRIVRSAIDVDSIHKCRLEIVQRFMDNLTSDRVDAKIDTSFGLALYALALLEELALHHVHQRVLGRLALRTLLEAVITLKYLVVKNDPALWKSYRVYGSGQAKLAFLKCQEAEGELPSFIDEDQLYSIANEDVWQEFLDISGALGPKHPEKDGNGVRHEGILRQLLFLAVCLRT